MRKKANVKKRRKTEQKQGRDNLRRIHHIAAALYWFVKLIREILS